MFSNTIENAMTKKKDDIYVSSEKERNAKGVTKLAPIVLFTYNRLNHTRNLINSLLENQLARESKLYIFSDGIKSKNDEKQVLEVREYLHTISGFQSIEIYESDVNRGLANSIVAGINKIFIQYDRIIVLEDDLILSPYFLRFMNEVLDLYVDDSRVGCVNGHVVDLMSYKPEMFFIKHIDCSGWGTWKRAWELYEPDGKKLLSQLEARNLCEAFDFGGSYPFVRMLRRQIAGENNSWAIRWRASLFLKDVVSVNAGKSLVFHAGSDGTGTNCGKREVFPTTLFCERPLKVSKEEPIETEKTRKVIHRIYKWYNSKLHKAIVMLQSFL